MSPASKKGKTGASGGKRKAGAAGSRRTATAKSSPRKRKSPRRSRRKPRPSFWQRLKRKLVLLLVLIGAGLLVAAFLYRHYVIQNPGDHMERAWILGVISQETQVYHRDGGTKLGVFFDEDHRQYVPYESMPEDFVHALVAAEDKRFFEHHGIDWIGLVRAMKHNVEAGRIVEGGSTLTQQTAENLFFEQRALTFPDKAREALNALRLEHHFTKGDILEFYSNQFYVNGNGRGLGIAARYFFDKSVDQLDTLECAFLAGVVQSPTRYDPFQSDDPEVRERCRKRALDRTHYVLRRMTEDGYLAEERRRELVALDLPFERGRFRFPYSVVLEEVARELGDEHFLELLAAHGIDNPSTAGIEIVTTLDPVIQDEALYGLRHHLTEVGIPLEGVTLDQLLKSVGDLGPVADSDLRIHTFHDGKVVSVDPDGRTLSVALGDGVRGTVDAEGCTRLATLLERSELKNRWSEASRAETGKLLGQIPVGSGLWVSIRERSGDELLLDVEYLTELQGAVVVLDSGHVRAMVGGNTNRDFNRAVQAKRQFGSTFKPLVYAAALQLGWSLTDELDNRRDVFPFEGSFYYPRPDHQGEDLVSLAWAGVKSENLASVWLLYHLTDHLNEAQFEQVATTAGLTRRADETREEFIVRIRDKEGIVPTEDRLREGLFERIREDVIVDLKFDLREEEADALQRLHYGLRFGTERARQSDRDKRAILRRSLLYLEERSHDCRASVDALKGSVDRGAPAVAGHDLHIGLTGGKSSISCGDPGEGWIPLTADHLAAPADGPSVADALLADERVLVLGQLSLATLATLRREIEAQVATATEGDLYQLSTLALLRDYRSLVSMRYVIALARQMGVASDLSTGLSLPLGSSDISLLELGLIYQCLQTGDAITFEGQGATALIAEIRLRDGTPIYRAEPRRRELLADGIPAELGQVLRGVVTHGTGKRAAAAFPDVPVAGKTGTTNSFRNAAFAGLVPRPADGSWSLEQGLAVASYVGYDDNRKMSRGSIRLAGATGSLPAWIGATRGIVQVEGGTVPADASLAVLPDATAVPVDPPTRLPQEGEDGGLSQYLMSAGGRFAPIGDGS